MSKYIFETGVSFSISDKGISISADGRNVNLNISDVGSFSYSEHTESKLTPSTLLFRFIGVSVGLVILSEFVFGGWSGPSWIFAIIVGVINVIVFFLFMLDSFLGLKLFASFIKKQFSDEGYVAIIGNKGGEDVKFVANLDELDKIKSLEKEINDVKTRISNNANSTNNLDELKKLGELKQMGVITEEEFNIKKSKLLNN